MPKQVVIEITEALEAQLNELASRKRATPEKALAWMLQEFAVSTPKQVEVQSEAQLHAFINFVRQPRIAWDIQEQRLSLEHIWMIFSYGYKQGWMLYQYRHTPQMLEYDTSTGNLRYAKLTPHPPLDDAAEQELAAFLAALRARREEHKQWLAEHAALRARGKDNGLPKSNGKKKFG